MILYLGWTTTLINPGCAKNTSRPYALKSDLLICLIKGRHLFSIQRSAQSWLRTLLFLCWVYKQRGGAQYTWEASQGRQWPVLQLKARVSYPKRKAELEYFLGSNPIREKKPSEFRAGLIPFFSDSEGAKCCVRWSWNKSFNGCCWPMLWLLPRNPP